MSKITIGQVIFFIQHEIIIIGNVIHWIYIVDPRITNICCSFVYLLLLYTIPLITIVAIKNLGYIKFQLQKNQVNLYKWIY